MAGRGRNLRIGLLLLAAGAGCSPAPPTGGYDRPAREAGAPSARSAGTGPAAQVPAPAGYLVTFAPSAPTAVDNVRAVLRDAATNREIATVSWTWIVNGRETGRDSDTLAAGSVRKGDEIEARATVGSSAGAIPAGSRKVRVANAPPRLIRAALSNRSPRKGDTISADAEAFDPDGDAVRLTYRWFAGGRVVQEGERSELVLAAANRGDEVYCEVVPGDGQATGISLATEAVAVLNSPPVIRTVPTASAGPEGSYVYRILAEDPDGDGLLYEMVEGPEGAAFAAGTFRWQVPAGFRGTLRVVIRVRDGAGGEAMQEFALNAVE